MKKLLGIKSVQQLTALARPTIYLYMKNNKFPKPIKVGTRSVRWLEEEIEQWIEGKININRT